MLKNILKKLIKKKNADLPNLSLIENFKIEKPNKPIKIFCLQLLQEDYFLT